MYMGVSPEHISVYHSMEFLICEEAQSEGVIFPETTCCWQSNSGPLKEQAVVFVTRASLEPHIPLPSPVNFSTFILSSWLSSGICASEYLQGAETPLTSVPIPQSDAILLSIFILAWDRYLFIKFNQLQHSHLCTAEYCMLA